MGTSPTIQPTIYPREPVDNGPRLHPPPLRTCGELRTLKQNHSPDRPAGLPAEQDSPGPQNHPNPNPNLSLRRRKRRRLPHHHLQHQHQHRNQNLKRRRNRRKKILKRRSLTKNKDETIDNQELISRTASEL